MDSPTISICPLIGRPNVCPEAPKKTPVSTCLNWTASSLCQKSPEQTTLQISPVSPSPGKKYINFYDYHGNVSRLTLKIGNNCHTCHTCHFMGKPLRAVLL